MREPQHFRDQLQVGMPEKKTTGNLSGKSKETWWAEIPGRPEPPLRAARMDLDLGMAPALRLGMLIVLELNQPMKIATIQWWAMELVETLNQRTAMVVMEAEVMEAAKTGLSR
jgi:hypothetical protein